MTEMRTERQVSAGGVIYRHFEDRIEVALIRVGPHKRWQLPKGTVDPGETPEQAAVREVREETGLSGRMLDPLETIEYWYAGGKGRDRVRYHKFVHFYLLEYAGGDTANHDHEVDEARWVDVDIAHDMLTFETERKVLDLAEKQIAKRARSHGGPRA